MAQDRDILTIVDWYIVYRMVPFSVTLKWLLIQTSIGHAIVGRWISQKLYKINTWLLQAT